MTPYFRYLLIPFMGLSFIGLVLSVLAHVLALMGQTLPVGNMIWDLHLGIFVIWIPVVLVSMRMMQGSSRKDFWKIGLRGCPAWMRYGAYGLFAYGIVNFICFAASMPQKGKQPMSETPTYQVVRGFSGHWMIFYGMGFCILFSAYRQGWEGMRRYCPNGHEVSLTAHFCDRCGSKIT